MTLEIKILRCEKWGRYTFVEAQTPEGIRGIGISRRAFNDKRNDDLGTVIATGRAKEAAMRKSLKRPITSQFMG